MHVVFLGYGRDEFIAEYSRYDKPGYRNYHIIGKTSYERKDASVAVTIMGSFLGKREHKIGKL